MAGIDPKTGLEIKNNKSAVESVTTDAVAEAEKKKFITGSEKNEKSTRTGRTNYDN